LDTTFGEDTSPVRDVPAAHNFSLMREFAMKRLKDHPRKGSLSLQRQWAALSPEFRSNWISPLFPAFDA